MDVRMVLTELTSLQKEVEKELKDIEYINYGEEDREEEFLFSQLTEAVSELRYVSESLKYVNKPVAKTGLVRWLGGHVFLDNLKLKSGDRIECLVDNYWERKDVFTVNGETYVEDLADLARTGADRVTGRIRLTEEELLDR